MVTIEMLSALEDRLMHRIEKVAGLLGGNNGGGIGDDFHACLDMLEASLDERLNRVEKQHLGCGEFNQRFQMMEQHINVLQAQTDALQSQLHKESSKAFHFADSLQKATEEVADLKANQFASIESLQGGMQILIGRIAQDSAIDPDCIDAITNLRSKLALTAEEIGAETGSYCDGSRLSNTQSTVPTLSPIDSLASLGRPPRARFANGGVNKDAPTLLGRAISVPTIDGRPNVSDTAKALAAALAQERNAAPVFSQCDDVAVPHGSPLLASRRTSRSPSKGTTGSQPLRRMATTGGCDRLPLGDEQQLMMEIKQLREHNLNLREENVAMRDKMLQHGRDKGETVRQPIPTQAVHAPLTQARGAHASSPRMTSPNQVPNVFQPASPALASRVLQPRTAVAMPPPIAAQNAPTRFVRR